MAPLEVTMDNPCEQSFALRLRPAARAAEPELAGEIEHVLSGERRRFASADELLARLAELRQRAAAPR